MHRSIVWLIVGAVSTAASVARADLNITLVATDAAMNPITGLVPVGTEVFVDILLSADDPDNPLPDLRGLTFALHETSSSLTLNGFVWHVDPDAYSVQLSDLPAPQAVTIFMGSDPSLLVLTDTPVLVATVSLTVNGVGTLDVINADADPIGTSLVAGFDNPIEFSLANQNLNGGGMQFAVEGAGGPDADGDGAPDNTDQFPDDPGEAADGDHDGVGDNADQDDDNDGVEDPDDAFPHDPDEQVDADGDGIGDNADPDDDNDGIVDAQDDLPTDPDETIDTDGDGTGNSADPDDDNDGVVDTEDAFATDPTRTTASDAPATAPRAPRGPCGVAMHTTMLSILAGLFTMGLCRRRTRYGG